MPASPNLAQLAHQFAWFESMCREVRQIINKDLPGSPTIVVLELGEEIAEKLAVQYQQMSEDEVSDDTALSDNPV